MNKKFTAKRILNDFNQRIWMDFQEQAFELGKYALQYLRDKIQVKAKRTPITGNLGQAFRFIPLETFGGQIHWAIGDIEELNDKAIYWYIVDTGQGKDGSPHIPFENAKGAPLGSFDGQKPQKDSSGNARYKFDGQYFMKPKKPVRPLNYIRETKDFIEGSLEELQKALTKKL